MLQQSIISCSVHHDTPARNWCVKLTWNHARGQFSRLCYIRESGLIILDTHMTTTVRYSNRSLTERLPQRDVVVVSCPVHWRHRRRHLACSGAPAASVPLSLKRPFSFTVGALRKRPYVSDDIYNVLLPYPLQRADVELCPR